MVLLKIMMKSEKKVVVPSLEQIEEARNSYRYRRKYAQTLRSTVAVLIVVAAVSVLVATLWMPVLQIYGSSMAPTLEDGEIVVSIKGSSYEPGDLVAFYYGNKLLIKRVIAGPGSWVDIDENGNVYVDGRMLDEPYVTEKTRGECDQVFPLQVNDERWFLLGDNRSVSVDSRSTLVGCVSEEQIVGRIFLQVGPLSGFGFYK